MNRLLFRRFLVRFIWKIHDLKNSNFQLWCDRDPGPSLLIWAIFMLEKVSRIELLNISARFTGWQCHPFGSFKMRWIKQASACYSDDTGIRQNYANHQTDSIRQIECFCSGNAGTRTAMNGEPFFWQCAVTGWVAGARRVSGPPRWTEVNKQ